jgi:hypothetical protein
MAKADKPKWYLKGQAGVSRAKQEDEAAKLRREQAQNKGPRRLWLANDTSTKLSFLDNPQFFLYEHQLKLGGNWRNWFTCRKDIDSCPVCESGDNPSYVVVATVINHREWKDKDGKDHKNEKQLAVFKGKARERILKRVEQCDGDLKGCVFEFSRGSSNTEASTGEDFVFLNKRLTDAQLLSLAPKGSDKSWVEPFDYAELLEPRTIEELRRIVGGETPVGSEDGDGGEGGEPEPEKEPEKESKKAPPKEEKKSEMSIDDLI